MGRGERAGLEGRKGATTATEPARPSRDGQACNDNGTHFAFLFTSRSSGVFKCNQPDVALRKALTALVPNCLCV